MVNQVPQFLELLFLEVLVQRILLDLCFVAVANHVLQDAFVIDGLNELMDAFYHGSNFLG